MAKEGRNGNCTRRTTYRNYRGLNVFVYVGILHTEFKNDPSKSSKLLTRVVPLYKLHCSIRVHVVRSPGAYTFAIYHFVGTCKIGVERFTNTFGTVWSQLSVD